MKKLNSKGFTLVELLAVIIILAIVVAITIPAVTSTISKSREKAGDTAAQIAANWIDEQFALGAVGGIGMDSTFKKVCGDFGMTCANDGATLDSSKDDFEAFVTAVGMKTDDVSSITVKIDSNTGKSCVTFTASDSGSYYVPGASTQEHKQGAGCSN